MGENIGNLVLNSIIIKVGSSMWIIKVKIKIKSLKLMVYDVESPQNMVLTKIAVSFKGVIREHRMISAQPSYTRKDQSQKEIFGKENSFTELFQKSTHVHSLCP